MERRGSTVCSTDERTICFAHSRNSKKIWMMLGFVISCLQPMWAVAGPPDHAKAVFLRGEVSMVHIDEVIPEKSRFAYFLHPNGSANLDGVMEMIFEGEPPGHLRTGKKVRVKGRATKSKIWVSEVAAVDGDSSSNTSSGTTAAAATTGDRKTITFVINMKGNGVDYATEGVSPYTQTHVDSSATAMHDPVQFSVNTAYDEASFGQVTFSGSAESDVFLVSVPYDPAEACAYYTIASNADAAAVAAFPINLNGYLHRLYVIPPKAISGCGWLALGQVGNYGSTTVRRSWSTRIDPIAFAHELGHNIGWHHAATDPDNDGTKNVEYGDTSDLMGYCCSKRKLNSVHVDQVGWFDHVSLKDKIVDVTSAGRYTLAPLGTDPTVSSDPQILKITPTTGRPYYLSYRQRVGRDAGMSSTYTTGVNIHRGEKSNNWSYFVKVLKSDFSDPNLYQFHDTVNELTISQVENNMNYVTFDLNFGEVCVASEPNVSVTPMTQLLTDINQLQPYSVTVTNTDTSACQSSSWNIDAVSQLTGTVTSPVLNVAPGSSVSTTIHMNVVGVEDGQYPITISATDLADATHDVQVSASLGLSVNTCVANAPTIQLAPSQQLVSAVSELQAYQLTVMNNDSTACPASEWTVSVNAGLGSSIMSQTLNVAPGDTGTTAINMQVSGASDGMYPIMVMVSDSHSSPVGQASASLQLDLMAPTAPSGVVAQLNGNGRNKAVQVSWNQANDGSGTGVVSYSVYRNGVELGSTTSLNYKDSNYSTTVDNTYEIYAVDQVGHMSAPGTVVYTDGGGGSKPGGGKGKK